MATYNDVTGDRLINIPKRGPRGTQQVRETYAEEKVFEVFDCKRCHIKVSTSNKKCPCCGEGLPNG